VRSRGTSMLGLSLTQAATMLQQARLLALSIFFPALAVAQTPRSIPAQPPMFEVLRDSQWIRVSGAGHNHREARLLQHSATAIVLDLEPHPERIPIASIDTLWQRRTASKTVALAGGLLGAGIGTLIATQVVEEGETPPADYVALLAIGGAVGGGVLGALLGRAFPKWHRLHPK
jgi:hypothetical protein